MSRTSRHCSPSTRDPNTWIVDLRHYLTPAGALADMPSRARHDDLLACIPGLPRPVAYDDSRPETLKLDITSVTVHHVENVTYGKSSFHVRRHRSVKHDPDF
jgi:hypothetical protein